MCIYQDTLMGVLEVHLDKKLNVYNKSRLLNRYSKKQFLLNSGLFWIFMGLQEMVCKCFRGTSGPKTKGT